MALTRTNVYINLDAGQPNQFINEYFLQGNTDKDFKIRIMKNNVQQDVGNTIKPILYVIYLDDKNKVISRHRLAPTMPDGSPNSDYNITVAENVITIPGQQLLTDHAGPTQIVLEIEDSGTFYTYSASYNVTYNPAYTTIGVIDNLPSLNDKANKDLSNVDNSVFAAKSSSAGVPTNDDLYSDLKYYDDPSSDTAGRIRYDKTSKNWIFEVKDGGVYTEKFRIGESAIVDVLKLVEGVKPTNIPSDELAFYNKSQIINGQQTIRPHFVLPNGDEYGFVVHDPKTDKAVFRNNAGQLVEIPTSASGSTTFSGLTDTPPSYNGMANKMVVVNAGETALDFKDVPTPGEVETLHFRHAFGVKAMNKTGQTINANSWVMLSPKTNGRYNMIPITKTIGYKGEMFGLLETQTANDAENVVNLIDNIQTGITTASEGVPAYIGFISEGLDNTVGIEEKDNFDIRFGKCGVFGGTNDIGEYMASFNCFQVQADYATQEHHDEDIDYHNTLPAVIDKKALFVYLIDDITSAGGTVFQQLPALSEVQKGMQIIIENQSPSELAKIRLTAVPGDKIEGADVYDVSGGNHKVLLVATDSGWTKFFDSLVHGGGDLAQQVATNTASIASNLVKINTNTGNISSNLTKINTNTQDITTLKTKSLTLTDGTNTVNNVEGITVTGAAVRDDTGGNATLAIPRQVEDLIEYGTSTQSTTPVDDSWKIGKMEPNQIVDINRTSGNKYLILLIPTYLESTIEEIKINNNVVEHREVDQTYNQREYKMLISTTTFDASQNMQFKIVYNSEVVPTGLEIDDGTNNKAGIKKIDVVNMKLSNIFDDSSTVTLTAEGTPTFVDGNNGTEFKADKIQSLDKSIRIAKISEGVADLAKGLTDHNEGIHAVLGNDEIINNKYNKSKLYFGDIRVKGGSSVYANMQNKSFVIQDVDPQDDPNISGGTTFIVCLYYEPNQDRENEITQNGNVKLGLFDNDDNPILNTDGNPMEVQIDYKMGDIEKPELYIGECKAKGYTEVHLKITPEFPGEELISVGANTQLCLQAISKDESSGLALLSFMAFTGYRIGFDTKYYGENSLNLAQSLIFDEPEIELSNETLYLGNNTYINVKTKAKISVSNYHLIIKDNGTDLPIWSIGKIYDELDSHFISGKNYKITAKLTDKDNSFRIGLLEYKGTTKPAPNPIVESFNNVTPVFTTGWTQFDSLFISEDAVSGEHVATKTFLIPDNSKGIAIIMYPNISQIPSTLRLKDLEGDITPWFNKTVITNNSHIREAYLELVNNAYRSIVITPSGYTGYRYTVDNTDTKLPAGVISGGDNKIINDNSWFDAGSSDPNKTQGDFKFLIDGKAKMSYTAKCFNEQGTLNQIHFWLAKNNGDGTFTEVPNSRIGTTIEANRNKTPKMVSSTQFEFNVLTNETYRFFGKSDKSDGFYLESLTDGVPLLRFDIDFEEITEFETNTNERLNLLDSELVITQNALDNGWYIELDYNPITQKPSLSPKQRGNP